VRPLLTLLACEAFCGDHQQARSAAAAVELIHNFSLLHDDIQDGSPLRRNKPTAWALWGAEQGINAGDAMFALAHLAIPRLAVPGSDPEILVRLLQILDETCLDLTRGQHLDMSFESRDDVRTEEYLDMISGKTAALLAASAQMGALAGGANEEEAVHYRAFGRNLGLAFQVLDDILDIWGKSDVIGKESAVDIRERKKTLPVLYGLARSEALRALYADSTVMTEDKVHQAIHLLADVEAREYAESVAQDYSRQTIVHLEALSPNYAAGEALYELVDSLLKRDH
jgi:geranylgeranyl diphosphate synthase type I